MYVCVCVLFFNQSFPSPRLVTKPKLKNQIFYTVCLLMVKEEKWNIHVFPKGISTKQNTNCTIQDLTSG